MANQGGDDVNRGLYDKYTVHRNDGRGNNPGDKHFNCEHFVLDLNHDPHAYKALIAYAKSCAVTHPKLSEDLLRRASRIGERLIEERLEQLEQERQTLQSVRQTIEERDSRDSMS